MRATLEEKLKELINRETELKEKAAKKRGEKDVLGVPEDKKIADPIIKANAAPGPEQAAPVPEQAAPAPAPAPEQAVPAPEPTAPVPAPEPTAPAPKVGGSRRRNKRPNSTKKLRKA